MDSYKLRKMTSSDKLDFFKSRKMSAEKLIHEVYIRPPLWESNNALSMNRPVLDVIWEEVARACSSPTHRYSANEVRTKWKNIKDTYRKELKKLPVVDGVIDFSVKPTWPYFEQMEFLRDQVIERINQKSNAERLSLNHHIIEEVTITKTSDYDNGFEAEPTYWSEVPTDTKRIKNEPGDQGPYENGQVDGQINVQNDEDYHFFMSILPHVRNLSSIQKLRFRSQIQNLLIYEEMANAISANCSET